MPEDEVEEAEEKVVEEETARRGKKRAIEGWTRDGKRETRG